MTKEQKDLLLKDLCARLPYGVKVYYFRSNNHDWYTLELIDISDDEVYISASDPYCNEFAKTDDVKPYLFPMSSMTENQKNELDQLFKISLKALMGEIDDKEINSSTFEFDFYNKYHLDWRGLIPMGLALDATGLNIY